MIGHPHKSAVSNPSFETVRDSGRDRHCVTRNFFGATTAERPHRRCTGLPSLRPRGRGFRLLGFDLLPRLKRLNKVRLYRPATGEPDPYCRLAPALRRPIRWDIIAEQYDQVIKYATAIRVGTASAEVILRRFTRPTPCTPPTKPSSKLAGPTHHLVARYLRDRDLQCEINEGLNVVESWANSVIFFGKGGQPQRPMAVVGAPNQHRYQRRAHPAPRCRSYRITD
jgi:Tn3 transposase DDE domain